MKKEKITFYNVGSKVAGSISMSIILAFGVLCILPLIMISNRIKNMDIQIYFFFGIMGSVLILFGIYSILSIFRNITIDFEKQEILLYNVFFRKIHFQSIEYVSVKNTYKGYYICFKLVSGKIIRYLGYYNLSKNLPGKEDKQETDRIAGRLNDIIKSQEIK